MSNTERTHQSRGDTELAWRAVAHPAGGDRGSSEGNPSDVTSDSPRVTPFA